MPEHLRALVVIVGVAAAMFYWFGRYVAASGIDPDDYRRRCTVWVLGTLAAFVPGNYWLYVLIAVGALLWGTRQERNPVAMFVFLLFALPALRNEIPGFGIMNYLFDLTYPRLLALFILLPAFFRLSKQEGYARFGSSPVDWMVLAGLVVMTLQQAMYDNVTGLMRGVFYSFVDVY